MNDQGVIAEMTEKSDVNPAIGHARKLIKLRLNAVGTGIATLLCYRCVRWQEV